MSLSVENKVFMRSPSTWVHFAVLLSGLILKYQIEYETNHMYYSNKFIAGINFNLAR